MPSLASNPLPRPKVIELAILDYSQYDLGWCITVEWAPVAGADLYLVRFRGRRGMTPQPADGSAAVNARWRGTGEYGYSPGDPNSMIACNLAENQQIKFRLRAVDLNSANQMGKATRPFTIKLPKFGSPPVLPRYAVPAIQLLG